MRHRQGALRAEIMRYVIIMAFTIGMFYPLVFMLLSIGKSNAELSLNFFGLPQDFRFENLVRGWNAVAPYIVNSILVSGISVISVVTLGVMSAYAFARFNFFGKRLLYFMVIALMMIPGILTFVPQFLIARDLGLLNTRWALILPYIAGGQVGAIFFLRIFFASLPQELVDAARVDGAGELLILFRIVLPLSFPTVMVIVVQNVLGTWNDYIWPLVTIGLNEHIRTVAIGLAFLPTEHDIPYGTMMAGYAISAIPMLLLFIFAMRYFIEGLTSGALKL